MKNNFKNLKNPNNHPKNVNGGLLYKLVTKLNQFVTNPQNHLKKQPPPFLKTNFFGFLFQFLLTFFLSFAFFSCNPTNPNPMDDGNGNRRPQIPQTLQRLGIMNFSIIPQETNISIFWQNPDNSSISVSSFNVSVVGYNQSMGGMLTNSNVSRNFVYAGNGMLQSFVITGLATNTYYQISMVVLDNNNQSLPSFNLSSRILTGINTDNDALVDTLDTDDDNDNVIDMLDAFPLNASESIDTDSDGVGDNSDNCVMVANTNQLNIDNDAMGDACDDDFDNDGVSDMAEAPGCANNTDCDSDGMNDSIDVDDDGDGLIELATAQQLNMMRNNLAGTGLSNTSGQVGNQSGCGGGSNTDSIAANTCGGYELVANINLNDLVSGATTGHNWNGIGFCGNSNCQDSVNNSGNLIPFSAILDGNGYNIYNMRITTASSTNGAGFFNVIQNATIRNTNLLGMFISINGGSRIGGLVGIVFGLNSIITNCLVVGSSISGSGSIGGIIGRVFTNNNGISQLQSSHSIFSNISSIGNSIGGLIGVSGDFNINNSLSAIGNIVSLRTSGGLIGIAASGTIVNHGIDVYNSLAITNRITGMDQLHQLIGGLFIGDMPAIFPSTNNSYWWSGVTGSTAFLDSSINGYGTRGIAQNTSQLQNPTSAMGIYSQWSGNCSNNTSKPIWDFGTSTEYPVINCFGNSITPAMLRSAITEALAGRDPTTVFR